MSKKITATFGFEVPVLVLLLEEIQAVVNANSFLQDKQKDIAFFHVTFLEEIPDTEKTITLQSFLIFFCFLFQKKHKEEKN